MYGQGVSGEAAEVAGWLGAGGGGGGGGGSDVYEWRLQVEQLKSLAGWVGG